MTFVSERVILSPELRQELEETPVDWGFGELSKATFYSRYSRFNEDTGKQEQFPDTVIRVVEGAGSLVKSHAKKIGRPWEPAFVSGRYVSQRHNLRGVWEGGILPRMARGMIRFTWLPPGRGLWIQGTKAVYERGNAALNNCMYIDVDKVLSAAAYEMMDHLMLGVGVGFSAEPAKGKLDGFFRPGQRPLGFTFNSFGNHETYIIPDTREGWAKSIRRLIASYETPNQPTVYFDYSLIRPYGSPIRTFGGTASGPEPLKQLHERLRKYLDARTREETSDTRLIVDTMNAIGACVVAGNVRRSAEIALGSPFNSEFLELKNYDLHPERGEIGWMSNNSVKLSASHDFTALPMIAEGIRRNGEPGFVNMMNVRRYGRFGREIGEDLATGFNPCLSGDTRVLTDRGYYPIQTLVGHPVRVWNGQEWSLVTPEVTGFNQPMVKVSFSDGTSLTTTTYHGFHINESYTQTTPTKVLAKSLQPGMRLWKYEMGVVESGELVDEKQAYTQGVYAGDGHIHKGKPEMWLYHDKQEFLPHLNYLRSREDPTRQRTAVILDPTTVLSKTFVPLAWDLSGRLAWFAGLLDTDGTLLVDGSLQVSSSVPEFLLETRLMLTTLGVQAKVTPSRDAGIRDLPDGRGGRKSYPVKRQYRLLVSAGDVVRLRTLGLHDYLQRIDIREIDPQRDARRFVTVVSVEDAGTEDTVYCFNEPLNHTGTFEGIVTAQCGEIALESHELCCLAEVFPTRCRDEAEVLEAMELATLYASAVQLLPSHAEETNAVVERNRRIGVSISGVADWLDASNVSEIIPTLREGYRRVRQTNKEFSEEMQVNEAIRVTTVKPSGTVSLLAGVSPGMHWPTHAHCIRRIRMAIGSPATQFLVDAGYPYEFDKVSDNTLVFEFPLAAGNGRTRGVGDVSVWEQASLVAMLQREWADNAVSNTLTFNQATEGKDLEKLISLFAPQVKSMSLLPKSDDTYPQMPYEGIFKYEYEDRLKKLKEIDWSTYSGGDGEDSKYCEGDSCELPIV